MFGVDPSVAKNPAIQERRLGKIAYSNELLLTSPPAVFKNLFSKVIPVKLDFDYADQTFQLVGFSELFDPVEQGEAIPLYQTLIKAVQKKRAVLYYISFARVEQPNLSDLFG